MTTAGAVPVIFDLDGTLIDSAPDIHASVARMLADEGRAPLDLATVVSFIGHGLPALVARVIDHVGLDPAEQGRLVAATLAHYSAAPVALTRPYPGVVAALDLLAGRGHPIGLCTNKPEAPARAVLRDLDLARYFAVVIGGDTLPVAKPDPAPLHAAIAALDATRAVYVGDSEVDAATALAAGMPFALFTEGYRKTPVAEIAHDAAFSAFEALPGIVARLAT